MDVDFVKLLLDPDGCVAPELELTQGVGLKLIVPEIKHMCMRVKMYVMYENNLNRFFFRKTEYITEKLSLERSGG